MPKILTARQAVLLLAISLVNAAPPASAQTIEIGATIGLSNYFGDLAPTPVISESKPAGGAFLRVNLSSSWAWTNSLMFAQVSGNDKNFTFNATRNLNFQTNIYEIASVIEFNYLKYGVGVLDKDFTSYLFAGIGFFGFDPSAEYDGERFNLRPFETEGKAYSPYAFNFPFGIGLKWSPGRSKHITFECQFGFRRTYTDHLDDVSDTYADINVQLQKGVVAAVVTDPSVLISGNGFVNKAGYKRGNKDLPDWYMLLGVSLSYRIYSKVKCSRFY
jgi:hypothetical protein